MIRIRREYAIIYVDTTGEVFNEDVENYAPEELNIDYYKNPGPLQWNFYLIIAREVIGNNLIQEIENNDTYTRKFVIEVSEIEGFIAKRFPVLNKKKGTITLIKEDSWKEAVKAANKEQKKNNARLYPSWNRNENINFSLIEMDKLRAKLILEPDHKAIFYTHNEKEYSLATKKFDIF